MLNKKRMFLDDYLFRGKYEEMARSLLNVIDNQSGTKIFNSAIELYMTSVVVGVAYDLKADPVKNGDQTFRIMASQFTLRGEELNFLFKLVMLSANKNSLENIDRMNNAFRYTPDDPEYQENSLLFEKYMLGGLKELYDTFIVSSNVRYEDYLATLCSFLDRFKAKNDSELPEEIDFDGDIF